MKEQLKQAAKAALKDHNKLKVDTLRSVLSAIQYEEMRKETTELDQNAIVAVLKNEVKKRKEALEYAEQGQRVDLIEELKREMLILEEFLPQQLGREQLEQIITELQKENPELTVGLAMKALKESYFGQYDGKLASDTARDLIKG